MTIKFATKNNSNGWRYQLEIDTQQKQFKYGSHFTTSYGQSMMPPNSFTLV